MFPLNLFRELDFYRFCHSGDLWEQLKNPRGLRRACDLADVFMGFEAVLQPGAAGKDTD